MRSKGLGQKINHAANICCTPFIQGIVLNIARNRKFKMLSLPTKRSVLLKDNT